jgi:two-component system, LuxR family, sensor kinase FixL
VQHQVIDSTTERTANANADPPERVLLVDDNATNLQVLYQTLSGRGYPLSVARNGLQALKIAQKSEPALILLDIMMPGIDGFETCRRLKKEARTRESAVIFLSALDDAANKVKGMQLGAVDYIAKPFDPNEVIARVETHLKIHRLEAQLARRNRQLEADNQHILAAMNEGIFGLDIDGTVIFVNPAAVRMAGCSDQDLLGKSLHALGLFGDSVASMQAHAFYSCLKDGRICHNEDSELVRRDGTRFAVEYNCSPMFVDQTLSGAVVVFKDISERKRAEKRLKRAYSELEKAHLELRDAQMRLIQAAKLESVGRLAAGVAHEVKNPLAVIQLGVDFLAGIESDDGMVSEVIRDMEEAVERADSVVKGLLDFSRESTLTLRRGDINQVIDHALHLVDHELTQHNIRLEKELEEGIGTIDLDSNKLQQVFINVFMNAIQAMGREGVLTVKSRVELLENPDGVGVDGKRFSAGEPVVRVEVLDTGCGIEDASMVFDPFYTTKPTGQGTGLGLSVTRKIIELHKGAIDIRNRREGGAAVRITLKMGC